MSEVTGLQALAERFHKHVEVTQEGLQLMSNLQDQVLQLMETTKSLAIRVVELERKLEQLGDAGNKKRPTGDQPIDLVRRSNS